MSKRYQGGVLGVGFNPLQAPNAPTIGTATGGDTTASVAFTAPANVGGSAITSYAVQSTPGGIGASGASSPITVSGLSNGTAYTFRVTALNSYGPSPASASSNSVTPTVVTGQQAYTTAGTYSWVAPAGVTSVSVVAVGGGGGGQFGENNAGNPGTAAGGGGGGVYKNTITVIPGNSYTVVVGAGGTAGNYNSATNAGSGGTSSFNSTVGATGGGSGASSSGPGGSGFGGDVNGVGGRGGAGDGQLFNSVARAGSGFFSGGGGGYPRGDFGAGIIYGGGGGGGTGILSSTGWSASQNAKGVYDFNAGQGFGPGSGANGGCSGSSGGTGSTSNIYCGYNIGVFGGAGGAYGGGGGDASYNSSGGAGAVGAVRIIWPGTTRLFPSTNTGNL
jgi:hypothetical protein